MNLLFSKHNTKCKFKRTWLGSLKINVILYNRVTGKPIGCQMENNVGRFDNIRAASPTVLLTLSGLTRPQCI